jgi:hypothetical protein
MGVVSITVDLFGFEIKRVLVKNGRVMPGLPGFVSKGNGTTYCLYCGKPLTDELSFARKIGPECIKVFGPVPGLEWIEGYSAAFKQYQNSQKRLNRQTQPFKVWLDERNKPEIINLKPKKRSRKKKVVL